ncbi:MAG: hypothetical protein ACE14S_04185 [Candidatus Bathyarchaeia archaeon]
MKAQTRLTHAKAFILIVTCLLMVTSLNIYSSNQLPPITVSAAPQFLSVSITPSGSVKLGANQKETFTANIQNEDLTTVEYTWSIASLPQNTETSTARYSLLTHGEKAEFTFLAPTTNTYLLTVTATSNSREGMATVTIGYLQAQPNPYVEAISNTDVVKTDGTWFTWENNGKQMLTSTNMTLVEQYAIANATATVQLLGVPLDPRVTVPPNIMVVENIGGAATFYNGELSGMTVSGGVYPGAPDYTIWKEGNLYYAKNANGALPSWGTGNANASYVIQTCIDQAQLGGGGIVALRSSVILTAPIDVKSQVWLVGNTEFGRNNRISISADIDIVKLHTYSGLTNLDICADSPVFSHSAIVVDDSDSRQNFNFLIRDVFVWRSITAATGGTGIRLSSENLSCGVTQGTIDKVTIHGRFSYGVLFNATNGGWVTSNIFNTLKVYACPYSVFMTQGTPNAISGNIFQGAVFQAHPDYTEVIVTVAGSRNTFDECYFWDVPDAKWNLNNTKGATNTRLHNSYLTGRLIDSGVLTDWSGSTIIANGVTKYFRFGGSATMLKGTSQVSVTHNCYWTPLCVTVTGSSADTASLYTAVNGTHLTIYTKDGIPISGDRTIYWFVSYQQP